MDYRLDPLATSILAILPFGLHGDEAQYWAWSQDLDWGYFSKPPMIAWIIAATTSVFGQAEWAVRLASPLLHSGITALVFLTGRKLFSGRIGFWAALTYALMPAVWLSATIISTDVALLFFYALGLYAWARLRERPSWAWACVLGLAIGLGLMSKYAMLFFIPPLILVVIFDRPTRRALLGPKGIFAGAIALICFVPNLIWNAQHDFATVTHTAENANLSGPLFHPTEALGFIAEQFGVFGPVSFALLCIAGVTAMRDRLDRPAIWLAAFAATPLIIITAQALLSRANANWAVSAYVAGPLLVAIWAVRRPRHLGWLKGGLAVQTVICLGLGVAVLTPSLAENPSIANAVKRQKGWPETAKAVEALFATGHNGQSFSAVATDNRLVHYDLQYYGVPDFAPLYMWRRNKTPGHHAELMAALPKTEEAPVLLINYFEDYAPEFAQDFTRLEPLPTIEIDLGGGKTRRLRAWAGYNYTPYAFDDRGR